jgi:hypothetical protein
MQSLHNSNAFNAALSDIMCQVWCSSVTDADEHCVQVVDDNLGFTKDRTISRLIDMQSREYLTQHAEKHAPELLLALHDRKGNRRSKSTSRHERGGLRSSVH